MEILQLHRRYHLGRFTAAIESVKVSHMNALDLIKTLGEDELSQPGHPLVLATLIMKLYPSFAEASRGDEEGVRMAEADTRLPGEGEQIKAAVDALELLASGAPIDDVVMVAKDSWYRSWAGGRPDLIEAGQQQANRIEPQFRAVAAAWRQSTQHA